MTLKTLNGLNPFSANRRNGFQFHYSQVGFFFDHTCKSTRSRQEKLPLCPLHSHNPLLFEPFGSQPLHYSSVSNKHSSDEILLPVIQSKIQCLQETDGHDRVSLFFLGGGGLWAVWLLRKCGKVKRKWNLYGFFL